MNWWPWSRPHGSDLPLHPHVAMPTVPEALQADLKRQPVCLLGERWTVPRRPDGAPVDFDQLSAN